MSRLLAIVVGCNYSDARRPEVPPLHAAEDDARHFSAFLTTTPLVNGELAMMHLLLGAEATTLNIREAVGRALAAQTSDDTLLFYFSGHGQKSDDGLLLYTWDSDYHARDLLATFNTDGPVRIVLDCCHAAAIAPSDPTESQ